MRDWSHIESYLNELASDVYSQPPDDGHLSMVQDIFTKWIYGMDLMDVLDVGCGATAIVQPFFDKMGARSYTGITLGDDVKSAQADGKNVLDMDMSFLDFPDNKFDMIWCRHTLEHSPFPLLTLMEFHRVSSMWLCVVVPNVTTYTYVGRNHYSVSTPEHWAWLFRRAGWKMVKIELNSQEYRFLCMKMPRISYEGYVPAPVSNAIYEFERDALKQDGRMIDVAETMTEMELIRKGIKKKGE